MRREKSISLPELLDKMEALMPPITPIYPTAFEVLIFCIISLRTKDEVAYPSADRLFTLGRTPMAIAKLSVEAIAQAIYPAGFYQRKASQIWAIAQDLASKGMEQPPADREALLTYTGVGLKTANLTLSRGFNIPAICVDIHVHRIANRLGFIQSNDPDESERLLREHIPQRYWSKINPILVYWGQHYCGAKAKCNLCPVRSDCPVG